MKAFLAVGINHFQIPGNDLSECVADAWSMKEIADKSLGIDLPTVLTDGNASKANVLAHLLPLINQAKSGTLTYLGISWSGHGTHWNTPNGGLGEALVCYDIAQVGDDWDPNTIIKDTELHNLLNQIPQTCTVEVWLDTCYSGGMDRAWHLPKYRFMHNPGNTDKVMRVANSGISQGLNSNIVMWCACSEAQTSADAPDLGNGAFTYYWLDSYQKTSHANRVDLLVATRKGLANGGYDQVPRLKCWNKAAQGIVGQ